MVHGTSSYHHQSTQYKCNSSYSTQHSRRGPLIIVGLLGEEGRQDLLDSWGAKVRIFVQEFNIRNILDGVS